MLRACGCAGSWAIRGIATALLRLGQMAHAEGDLGHAATLLAGSLDLHRDLGHKPGLAQALLHLGWVALDQGRQPGDALLRGEPALAQELGSLRGQADSLLGLAAVAQARGQMAQAAQLLDRIAGLPIRQRPPVPSDPQRRYDQIRAAVRAQLGKDAAT